MTVPTLSSATIPSAGTSITLLFSEAVTIGAGGNGGWTITMDGGAATLTYASGSGTSSLVYTLSRTVNSGETGTVAYTQPGDGVEDAAGNDLATIASHAVTNNSSGGLLIDEDFEGAGTPAGFTIDSGSPDFDNTSSPIAGSQDLLFQSGATSEVTIDFADSDELWITFRRKSSSFDQGTFFYAIKADFSQVVALRRSTVDADKLILFQNAAQVGSASVDSLPLSDTYYFFHVKKGTGANAEYEASFSTDGTRPTSGNAYIAHTSGTFTGQFEKLYIIHRDTEVWTDQYDNLKVSSTGWPS